MICRPYAIDADVVWRPPVHDAPADARTVAVGGRTELTFAAAVNPDCSSRGVPQLRVSQRPAHGTAAVFERAGYPRFAPASRLAACNATLVPGAVLAYTPAPGFSGRDEISVEETDVDGGRHLFRMELTVR